MQKQSDCVLFIGLRLEAWQQQNALEELLVLFLVPQIHDGQGDDPAGIA